MILIEVIVLLAVATAGLLAGRWLRLPPIVAYLLAGLLAGPGGFGLVSPSEATENLAEIGVALLLFGVGIEFSLDRIRRILMRMLTTGLLQVGVTIALATAIFHRFDYDWPSAVFAGFVLSLSSTAIVFKIYGQEGTLDAPQGQAAAAILLFQDLALVPMMLLIPVLAGPPSNAAVAATGALIKAAVAVGGLILLARTLLPKGLALVARAGIPEIFPIISLVIAFGTALGASALGLSLPIGAFLAGLALSGSVYAHQVFAEILPLRDAFVAIFFTSIGMLFEPAIVAAAPMLMAGMIAVVAIKGALIGAIVGTLWRSRRLAIVSGLGLAQIGEFSLVLAQQGLDAGIIDASFSQALLGAAILTMGATPFLMRAGTRLSRIDSASVESTATRQMRQHVVMVGYGTTGKAVARVLRETGIAFCGVDLNADSVAEARRENLPIQFGDATRRAVLENLGVPSARAAVVAVSDPVATRLIVGLIRQMNGDLRLIVRARYVSEIIELERLGADEAIPSEFETSIEIFARLLAHLGVPRHLIRVQESIIRVGHYQALRGIGLSTEFMEETRRIIAGGILETAQVIEGSEACGKTIRELEFRKRTGATVLNVVRDENPLPEVTPDTQLEAGDQLVLYGPHEAIDAAFRIIEPTVYKGSGYAAEGPEEGGKP
ncbi:MAG: cation:proton antiporter [Deltaproteobacteria bacterium]|nr:cation:proton antiporter [Deltaproteobacteria bacterium]